MAAESVKTPSGPGHGRGTVPKRPNPSQPRKGTKPSYKEKYKTGEPVEQDLTGMTLQNTGVNLPAIPATEKQEYPVKKRTEEPVQLPELVMGRRHWPKQPRVVEDVSLAIGSDNLFQGGGKTNKSMLEEQKLAAEETDEEEDEDSILRKLMEELNMLNEIEEVVENVLACIRLGVPIQLSRVQKKDYRPGIKRLPMFHCKRCRDQWERYGNVPLQCANPKDLAIPISLEAAVYFERIIEENVRREEEEEQENVLDNMKMFVKLANVRKKKKEQKQKDKESNAQKLSKSHSEVDTEKLKSKSHKDLSAQKLDRSDPGLSSCSSESEMSDKDKEGIFWGKTESGTKIYVVDDDDEEGKITDAHDEKQQVDKEEISTKHKGGKGTLRRIKLSEALKQHEDLKSKSGSAGTGGTFSGMGGAGGIKLTGAMFSFSEETDKHKTSQEKAKDWFNQMKAQQEKRRAQAKNMKKRGKTEKHQALHHSRGLQSPSMYRKNYDRSSLSSSGSGSSMESWEEERYVEILDEVTGELRRVEVTKKRGRRYKSRSGKKRRNRQRGDKRKGRRKSGSRSSEGSDFESSYWSGSTSDEEGSKREKRNGERRRRRRRKGYEKDEVNITLEDLLEECADDAELTEFVNNLIQSSESGEEGAIKASEIETLLADLEEVCESKSLMNLLEAPNMADMLAQAKEPFKLKNFLQKVQAVTPKEEKFASLGAKDIESLLPDLLDPNRQKDVRYQKLLKDLVKRAKLRVQEQIDATKKRKKWSEGKNRGGGGQDASTPYWWESDDEEYERSGGKLKKKKRKTKAGVKEEAFRTLIKTGGTGPGVFTDSYDRAHEVDSQGNTYPPHGHDRATASDKTSHVQGGTATMGILPANSSDVPDLESKSFVGGVASLGPQDTIPAEGLTKDETGVEENRYLQRKHNLKIKKKQQIPTQQRMTAGHHSKTIEGGGLRKMSISTQERELKVGKERRFSLKMQNQESTENIPMRLPLKENIIKEDADEFDVKDNKHDKNIVKEKHEIRQLPKLPRIEKSPSKPVAKVAPTVQKKKKVESSSSSSESEIDEIEAKMIAYRSKRQSIFMPDINEFAFRFSSGFSGLGSALPAYKNRKDSLVKQADNLKNKKHVPKKKGKRNPNLPVPAPLKPSGVSKLSRKLQKEVANPKPIADYVKRPIPKAKKRSFQKKVIAEEQEEEKQESTVSVDQDDVDKEKAANIQSKSNSKNTFSDESVEELMNLQEDSEENSDKNTSNKDNGESLVNLKSATPPAEPEHKVIIDRDVTMKKSELVAVYDIN